MDCSVKPLVAHYDLKRPCDWSGVFGRKAPLTVEIGFGLGEVLTQKALEAPGVNFIGIETHWERIYKTLKRIQREGAETQNNIRILRLDATPALKRLFGQETIDEMYCLFPCPWPKKKHIKHRLFSKESLRLINSRLKDKSRLSIVTDYFPYFEWIKEESRGCGFKVEAKQANPGFNTKFERKWRGEGQETFFELAMTKIKHVNVPVEADVPLKTYTVDTFDPKKFVLEAHKGEAAVVFKELLFDADKQLALVHVLVAEEHLTQDFWAAIVKTNKGWLIKKADGHYFFPTPGIAQALKSVYQAAKQAKR